MDITLNLPKDWHQVTGEQLVQLAKLFMRYKEKPYFLSKCFFYFSGWRPLRKREFIRDNTQYNWFRSRKSRFFISVQLFASLVKTLEWIPAGIKLPATMPYVKGYKHCNLKLYNVSLEDYLSADNYFNAYIQTRQVKYINKLFYLFYKPKNAIVKLMPVSRYRKYAVFMWFTGVRAFMADKYPYLFSGKGPATGSPEDTILDLLSSLNNGDVTANEKIFKTHIHECFYELNLKIENAPKNKK